LLLRLERPSFQDKKERGGGGGKKKGKKKKEEKGEGGGKKRTCDPLTVTLHPSFTFSSGARCRRQMSRKEEEEKAPNRKKKKEGREWRQNPPCSFSPYPLWLHQVWKGGKGGKGNSREGGRGRREKMMPCLELHFTLPISLTGLQGCEGRGGGKRGRGKGRFHRGGGKKGGVSQRGSR